RLNVDWVEHISENPRVTDNELEDELAMEVLRGEKLRLNILICGVASALILLNLLPFLLLNEFQRAFHGSFRTFQFGVTIVTVLTIFYLLAERLLIARHLQKKKRLGEVRQYLSALIETSIPTAGVMFGAFLLGPANGLSSPVVFWYFLFILVSALRLN